MLLPPADSSPKPDKLLPTCQQQPPSNSETVDGPPSCWNPHWTVRAIAFLACGSVIMQLSAISEYMIDRACRDLYDASCSTLTHHEHSLANSRAAAISTFTTSLPAGIALVTTVYLAVQGDFTGRKKFIAFNLGMLLLGQLTVLLAATLELPMWMFVIGTCTISVGGAVPALTAMLFAHTADSTSPAERAITFAYLEGSVVIAAAAGNLALGYLSTIGTTAPFICVVSLSSTALLLCLIFFPKLSKQPTDEVRCTYTHLLCAGKSSSVLAARWLIL